LRSEHSKADDTVLYSGPIYRFADWPNISVPTFGAGVYTIWHFDGRFVYVGMSGRGIAADTKRRNTPHGIYTRLQVISVDVGVVINSASMWRIVLCFQTILK
jgi:hypothetical protein